MNDEKYFQIVAEELRSNRINDALWTKAIAKSQGDENKTKATYINLRVEQLMQEEKRSRHGPTGDGTDDGAEEVGSTESSEDDRQMKLGMMAGQAIIFIIGIVVIWKFLFPWVREMKNRMVE